MSNGTQAVLERAGSMSGSGQPSRELLGWIQSIHFENMGELFDNALTDFGEDEVRAHLAELADWTGRQVARMMPWSEVDDFLQMAGSNCNLCWLRQQARENPAWAALMECVTVEAPQHYFEEMLPGWGQSETGIGATAGAGVSR
jgi:hypothetical protein